MPAVIYLSRLAYNHRTLPWHQIGTPIQDDATVPETLKALKLDYTVGLARSGGYQWVDGSGAVTGLNEQSLDNALAVIRYDQYTGESYVLGKATERFELVQNARLAEIVAPLSRHGRLETMGALDEGGRFFITFKGESWSFLNKSNGHNEAHEMYMVVKNTHLPGSSLQIQLTNVRLVCKNTWVAGDRSNILDIPLAHQGNADLLAQMVIEAMAKLPDHREKIIRAAEYLSAKNVTEEWVKEGIEAAFPLPKKSRVQDALESGSIVIPQELAVMGVDADELIARKDSSFSAVKDRMMNLRKAALTTYNESETVSRGTAWGYYNAITETVDYGVRNNGISKQNNKAAQANFWGERAGFKANAWEYAASNN